MTAAVIRTAGPDDLPACAAIINDWLDEVTWLPRVKTQDDIRAMFVPEILADRTILVAGAAPAVLGYLSVGPDAHIRALYLAPAARGQGAGRALIDVAKAHCPDGLTLTVFEPNVDARRFYAREGFAEVPGSRDLTWEEGVPVLTYAWRPA